MAFKSGTRVDPRLGALDFSGFTNAANIRANSIAQLGATIGGAIQVAGEKKKEKALSKQAQEMVFGFLKSDPEQANFFGLPEDFEISDVKPIIDVLGSKPSIALMTQLKMAGMKEDQTKPPKFLSIKSLATFKENLDGDLDITPEGLIVDTTFRNKILPFDDPRVQQLMQTKEGQYYLRGYNKLELLDQTVGDASQDNTIIDLGTLTRR